MGKVKGDKSKKIGGQRNKGSSAKKSSMAKAPRGKPVVYRGGQKGYQHR
jgi:hypothetical protein